MKRFAKNIVVASAMMATLCSIIVTTAIVAVAAASNFGLLAMAAALFMFTAFWLAGFAVAEQSGVFAKADEWVNR